MVVANNIKVESTPTRDPTIWTYVDTNHRLPDKNSKDMEEKEIKTNCCLPEKKGRLYAKSLAMSKH